MSGVSTAGRIVIRGGQVVGADGHDDEPQRADVAVANGRIQVVGVVTPEPGDHLLDADGRLVLPGFVDMHCHVDATIFEEGVQWAFLRQGVTTALAGQDGVSFAPGDGRYASDYFAALNGTHPHYRGGGVAALLTAYDQATAVNMAYLVPAGTVRHAVLGYAGGPADEEQIRAMQALVAQGLAEGAVGLSTGLDYVPNAHQDTAELIALCRPLAAAGGLYVTHMRGGYEENSHIGTSEIAAIAQATGVPAHISHYHGQAVDLVALLDGMTSEGVDVTFDAYPYRRGFTLLSMVVLPPELLSADKTEVAARLRDPSVRRGLRESWFPRFEATSVLRDFWPDAGRIAHVAAPSYAWAQGLTVREAAARAGLDPIDISLDLLAASDLDVSAVFRVRTPRTYESLLPLFTHPGFTGGSDGITIGAHPHPRAFGSFAKYLRMFVREMGAWSWADAVRNLSTRPSARLGLSDRGAVRPGLAADLVLADPDGVADRATYDAPRAPAVGIEDVLVGGVQVLRGGELTGATSGRGLRRTTSP